ncbi:hypothetical protein COT64_00515 [Candidatus Shapirobacteria bacterium CG09_land_8_20_14_0_10_39_12]|uniref:L,D-TPase catalytic domain-containing protein n=1 Tax=Candidatus Shapirobacteria bacterium CG09_land_8_20_14_0_10_39_12 TaxID=1974885 RepID=A0A2H0WQ98_9BACT|nr:MAG: hypothetical protein COT64_00515 [Candidatus Shapirobacteria bacterium CG09_land_8_20_14_0_10_39_12]
MKKVNKFFIITLPVLVFAALAILGLSLDNFKKNKAADFDLNIGNGDFNLSETQAIFLNEKIAAPLAALPEPAKSAVLGDVSPGDKWIEIDLSEQKLTAWEGRSVFLESLVSSGKWGRTPTGEFNIWGKFKYAKMSGGNKELHTYYYLPNVPYTMYFYKDFGLHGTYWHNNFGTPMSHGCVNLPTLVAEKLFYWTTPTMPDGKNSVSASRADTGTRVVIHN